MPALKREASPEFVAKIQALEDLSDQSYRKVTLFRRSWNLGTWLSLCESVRRVESAVPREEYGGVRHVMAVINIGTMTTQLVRWCSEHGARPDAPLSRFRWSEQHKGEVAQALDMAYQYAGFCGIFPAWHNNLCAAELLSDSEIAFFVPLTKEEHRVAAYEKGLRPTSGRRREVPQMVPRPTGFDRLLSEVLPTARAKGTYGMRIKRRDEVERITFDMYKGRLEQLLRRYEDIQVGFYTLQDFRAFYAGLLAIVGADDYVCYMWSRSHPFPLEAAVLVRTRGEWIRNVADLAGIKTDTAAAIVDDLTFGRVRIGDLNIGPFVPVNSAGTQLAVAPQFPLQSNWEENILRTCSYLRPEVFNITTDSKQGEMMEALEKRAHAGLRVCGPRKLPKTLPDIDLLLVDDEAALLVISETKWLRKPYTIRERIQQESELRKGIRQLRAIRDFLKKNDDYLMKRETAITRRLADYKRVVYCVVARDCLIYNDPADVPVFAFDAFTEALKQEDTNLALDTLLSLDWLPKEGTDFSMKSIPSDVPGVKIWLDVYTPLYT